MKGCSITIRFLFVHNKCTFVFENEVQNDSLKEFMNKIWPSSDRTISPMVVLLDRFCDTREQAEKVSIPGMKKTVAQMV
jgi:hypothetical protein